MSAMPYRAASNALLVVMLGAIGAGAQAPAPPDTTAPQFAVGLSRGDSAAADRNEFAWFGRGFVAGALTGPVGTWWAVKRASRSRAEAPSDGVQVASIEPAYQQGFQQGYVRRARNERKEFAFMGGAVGTAVFVYALIRIANLDDRASSKGDPGGGGPPLLRIPVRIPALTR